MEVIYVASATARAEATDERVREAIGRLEARGVRLTARLIAAEARCSLRAVLRARSGTRPTVGEKVSSGNAPRTRPGLASGNVPKGASGNGVPEKDAVASGNALITTDGEDGQKEPRRELMDGLPIGALVRGHCGGCGRTIGVDGLARVGDRIRCPCGREGVLGRRVERSELRTGTRAARRAQNAQDGRSAPRR